MYRLSRTSKERLKTCHNDLQLIVNTAITRTPVDFGVAQGSRTVIEQQQYYDKGASKVNPKAYKTMEDLLKRGKHIVDGKIRKNSMAVDLYAYYDSGARWDENHLCLIAGVMYSVAKELKEQCAITHDLRWGGNWDGDGIILFDQSFRDLPHYELI